MPRKWRSAPRGERRALVDVGEDARDALDLADRARSPPRAREWHAASGCSPNSSPPPGSVHAPTSTSIAESRASRIRSSSRRRSRSCRGASGSARRTAARPPGRSAGRSAVTARAHGRSSAATNRGSRAREAGTRSPITRPIVSRTRPRAARRRAAWSKRAGRARNAWTTRLRTSFDRNRAVMARSYAVSAAASPSSARLTAAAARLADVSARCSPSPVKGSRNPAASPTSSQPRPARRSARTPSGDAPSIVSHLVGGRPVDGIVRRRRDRSEHGGDRRLRALPPQPLQPRAAEHDPDVDAAPGHRREPDIAAVEQDDPGVIAPLRSRIRDMEREADARGEPGGPGHAKRAGDNRPQPIGADDDGSPDRNASGQHHPPFLDGRDGLAEPNDDSRRRGQVDEQRVKRRPVEPDGRGDELAVVAVRQTERRPCRGLDPHRRDGSGDSRNVRLVETGLAEHVDGRRRREHAAGAPAIGGRPLEQDDPPPAPGEQRGRQRPRRPAPDDDRVDRHACTAAIATRCRTNPPTSPTVRRPALSTRPRSSSRLYARRTDSGASFRVSRFRVAPWLISQAPAQ